MPIGRFLAGVAALIWNPETNQYLLLRRAGDRDWGAAAWECVTGRVDQGESYEQALYREVREEIGGEALVEFLVGTTHFYRGEARPETELLGMIYGCTLKNPHAVAIGHEHSEMRWATPEEARAFLPEKHWLRKVIARAELIRAELPQELRSFYRAQGFEI